MIKTLEIKTGRQGLHDISTQIDGAVQQSGCEEGLCTIFIQHTSASLVIQENCDPAVRCDLENWMNRLIPENDPLYTHTQEGPDDMPAHLKAALTATSLSIPIIDGQLALGTWQGVFLWEHRRHSNTRIIVVHFSD